MGLHFGDRAVHSFGANPLGRGPSQTVAGANIWPGTYPGAGFHSSGARIATTILQLARVSVSQPIPDACTLAGGDRQLREVPVRGYLAVRGPPCPDNQRAQRARAYKPARMGSALPVACI